MSWKSCPCGFWSGSRARRFGSVATDCVSVGLCTSVLVPCVFSRANEPFYHIECTLHMDSVALAALCRLNEAPTPRPNPRRCERNASVDCANRMFCSDTHHGTATTYVPLLLRFCRQLGRFLERISPIGRQVSSDGCKRIAYVPCGKQHFREIATPDWVGRFTNLAYWWVYSHVRKVLTQSGVAISRKCCFPHGIRRMRACVSNWIWVLTYANSFVQSWVRNCAMFCSLHWNLQTDRIRRMCVCLCVCVCVFAILMQWFSKILEWWLQKDRMRRMRVCLWSWCDDVVNSWSDGYNWIAYVACVCVCLRFWCDDVVKFWSDCVCVFVCLFVIRMRWCCKILGWWLQKDRIRRMRVCLCVFVCDPDATML